jgi:hypothetical protein
MDSVSEFYTLIFLLLLAKDYDIYGSYTVFSAGPTTADRPVTNRLQLARARAVSTFVRGFSVRHRNVQAVQVRRLNPPRLQALLHAPPAFGV